MKNTVFNGMAGVTGTGAAGTSGVNMAAAAGLVALSGGVGVLEMPKPYVEMPKVADTVKAVKEYSAEVLANAHITLRELKQKISSTGSEKLPSFKQLTTMGAPVVALKEVQGARITVYENGFASYEENGNHTVIAVDRCGGYRYDFTDGFDYIEADVFEDAEWSVRLVMEGENRLEANRARNKVRNETEMPECDADVDVDSAMVDFMDTENMKLLADKEIKRLYTAIGKLTERQQEVIALYYFKEMTMQEIGDELGISQQGVNKILTLAIKKLKKVF